MKYPHAEGCNCEECKTGGRDPKRDVILCTVSFCENPARWQDALRGIPITGGRKLCQHHALMYGSSETLVPFFNAKEEESPGPPPDLREWVKMLGDRIAQLEAEGAVLKESRAAAVSQEQSSRVECNKLRTQLAEAQANAKYWVEQHGIEAGKRGQCEHELDEARGNLAGQMERIERERDEAQAALFNMQSLANADCPKCDRLRKALMSLWNKGPDCPGVQEEVETALKGQP